MFNKLIVSTLPLMPKRLVYVFAKKYIAGPKLEDAVKWTKKLAEQGGRTTIDVLGEFVTKKEQSIHERDVCKLVLDAIHENSLPSYLSVKPTALGLGIDPEFGYENIKSICEKAKELNVFVRLDMENVPYTQATIDLYKRLKDEGCNVGIVLQSYLKRTEQDIRSLLPYKPNVRICKGIYNESPEFAYKKREKIREQFKLHLDMLLDDASNGTYANIATHDEPLIQYAEEQIKKHSLTKDQYQFEMLLGVRERRRDELLKNGHNLCAYTPFGDDWYGYSTRRLKENPKMAGHIVKAIFGFGK